jgi:hypothetical protein
VEYLHFHINFHVFGHNFFQNFSILFINSSFCSPKNELKSESEFIEIGFIFEKLEWFERRWTMFAVPDVVHSFRIEILALYTVIQKSNASNYAGIIMWVLSDQHISNPNTFHIYYLLVTPYVSFTKQRIVKTRSYWIKHGKWTIKKGSVLGPKKVMHQNCWSK